MSHTRVNVREASVPESLSIQALVEVWAQRIPDGVVMAAPGRASLTYGGLWRHLETVMHALRARGVGRHDRVAMVLPQGPEMAAAFVAVAACATAAPLNPAYRASEFEFYLADLHAKALLIESGMDSPARAVAQARGLPIIELVSVSEAAAGIFTLAGGEVAHPVQHGFAQSGDVALVLHTSGTTARPKSVPLTHTNLCASAQNIAATLALTESDRCLNIMPLFHIHGLIAGTLASLAAGASVAYPPGFYAPQFFAWLNDLKPTWYTAVPAMHQAVLKRARLHRETAIGGALRFIRSSSAPLPPMVTEELEELFKVPVIEAYGMTEASHQIASNPLPPRQRKVGSVGVATGSEIAIVNEQGKFLSAGRRGEILIRGTSIIRRYENRSEADREAFVDGWFRTGDQGYLDEEDYLFITGRLKEMINRGGEKISPREIDDVLVDHPAVTQAVTFAVSHSSLGEDVAAAVVLHKNAAVNERELQEFAAERLADFKVPRRVLILDELPKSATGKVQRLGLAETLGVQPFDESDPDVRTISVPPRTWVEEKLVEIWSEVLGVDQVGVHDNFYALGGDSILAAQVISRIRDGMHVELSFLAFFETPTIAGVAARLESSGHKVLTLPRLPRGSPIEDKELPLSCAQERLWFLERLEPGSSAYNRPTFFRLRGRLNVAALEQSLNEIARRHEILRSTFSSTDGQPFQRVSPHRALSLAVVNLESLSGRTREAEAQKLAAEEAQRLFDLAQGPLLRAGLLRLGDEEHILLLTIHHIAFDGWSQGVLLRELTALYGAFCAGKPSPLAGLHIQYKDFAVWQRRWLEGDGASAHLAYWKKQLEGAPPLLALPTDRPRPAVRSFRGAREPLVLSTDLTMALKALSRQAEVSLFMTLLAAFQALLYRTTGQADISIGTFNANRTSVETESLIGFFVNNLVLRTHLSGDSRFRELLHRVREVCLGAYEHSELPFEKLLEELQPQRSPSYSPLFQVMFVLQNAPQPPSRLSNLTLRRYPTAEGNRSNFDLTLELSEETEGLTGHVEYSTDLFDATTMHRMLENFRSLLKVIVADPDQRLSALPPVPGTVDDASIRALKLAQRRANLSAAKQTLLAKRLRGEFAGSLEDSQGSQLPEPHSRALTLGPIVRRADRRAVPLSFAQQRLWFLDQLEPGTSLYNIHRATRLNGPLNVSALQQTLDAIVDRHEALRTTFVTIDGTPVQRMAEHRPVELAVIDLSACAATEREAETQRLLYEEARRPFNLSSDLMLRAALLRLGNEEHVFILTTHHIASDGWSMGILFQEVATLYAAFSAGKTSTLPELPIQYADFALWQREWLRGEVLAKQLAYWKNRLSALPVLVLPTDQSRPPRQSYRGARQSLTLSRSLSVSLKALSLRERVSLFMTLLAAFQALLHRYTGTNDIGVGSPIAGRTRVETENLIGFFVNTLVLRSDLSGDPTFLELLRRVREGALEAYANQDLPFEKLVEELQPERDPRRHPLFQVMFALQNAPRQSMEMCGLAVTPLRMDGETAKFDLSLSMVETERGMAGSLVYNTDLFHAATMSRMLDHFQILLRGVVANPAQRLSELPLLTDAEKRQLLVEWNDTKRDDPTHTSIHELFEAQVEQSPEAVAVVFEGQQLSYRELNRRANQLAHYLIKLGVGPEVLVGICVERSLEMVIGILGVLKAGGAYVPLDPQYPKERLAFMLADSRPLVLLAQHPLANAPNKDGRSKEKEDSDSQCSIFDPRTAVIYLDTDWELISRESEETPSVLITPENSAYVIYTSGSTGAPKGVVIAHRSLGNFVSSAAAAFALAPRDRVLQFASISFDTAVEEIFPGLIRGATLVLRTNSMLESVSVFFERCRVWEITVLDLPTIFWHEMVEALSSGQLTLPERVRLVIAGGEKALPERLAQWRQAVGDRVRLFNTYGPTEATVVATMWEQLGGADGLPREVPIGRPISNVQSYLLDRNLNPVPVGVSGELHLGGIGLARGYLNRPDLTAQSFIPSPFRDDPGERLYKTGDLARYLPDGNIEFLGRVDNQVKIRGFRVEPGEIEAILSQHPAVTEAVVAAREDSPGDKRLVAYVVPKEKRTAVTDELRSFLKQKLPEHMVPSGFMFLDRLPLTQNGKLDRNALLATRPTMSSKDEDFAAARDELEMQLTQIWEKILRKRPIGLKDNFFDLGGHSLLAVRLISQVEKLTGQHLSLASLFQGPTIEDQAKLVRREGWSPPWSSLVAIQPGGSKPPLFCVHAHDGNVLFWRELSRRLGPEQPFYGLQAHGLDGKQAPDTRIEDMASRYVREIRLLQSEGPYFLGGHCLGGLIAFEMAQQLQAEGQRVAVLALIDSFAPLGKQTIRRRIPLRHRVKRSLALVRLHIDNLMLLGWGEKLSYVEVKFNRLLYKMYMAVGTPWVLTAQARRRVLAAGVQARRNYNPNVYPGSITLFRATEMLPGQGVEPQVRWGKLAAGGLEVHLIPGYFAQTVYEPRVRLLAEKLAACLDRARVLCAIFAMLGFSLGMTLV